jgi:4-carboxymuconolactone decarboxylase
MTDSATTGDTREKAAAIMRQMLSLEKVANMEAAKTSDGFCPEFAKLAMENVYVPLWTRPGLGLKERSLVTLGILIASGVERELRSHVEGALRNGVTREELEEVIYHATAYAGFPADGSGGGVAAEVVATWDAERSTTSFK